MNQLRITFIIIAILTSIDGFTQDRANATSATIVNPEVKQLNMSNQSNTSTDSHDLKVIAKLPMNAIHFQNKGTRPKIEKHWEDTMVQNESFHLNESNTSKSVVTQYEPNLTLDGVQQSVY